MAGHRSLAAGRHGQSLDLEILRRCIAECPPLAQAGQPAAVLYTILVNCRRLGMDPREYLVDVLTRLPAMQASEAATLTPAAWLAARQGRALRQVA